MGTKLAFVGTGWIAKVHAEAASKIDDVELVAAVNPHRTSLEAFADAYRIPRRYASIPEMIADGNIDALVINTPNFRHKSEAIAALEAGIHVLVEKPMTVNAEEARLLSEAAQRSEAKLMVAQNWQWDEEMLWLKEQIDKGQIGRIVRTHARAVHVNWGPTGWFTRKELAGGGALIDMGVHAIDATRFLLGEPKARSVYACIGTHYINEDVDDTALVMIHWENGAVSTIEAGWWQPHADGQDVAVQVFGKDGFASVFPTMLKTPDRDKGTIHRFDPGFLMPRSEASARAMYDKQMAYFIACVRGNQMPSPDAQTGLATMQIIDAAYRSAVSGEVVTLNESEN